jgi:hypothetical protein
MQLRACGIWTWTCNGATEKMATKMLKKMRKNLIWCMQGNRTLRPSPYNENVP